MAAVTHRVATPSTSNASSYASGSFTPAVGDLLVAFVTASGTVAGGSMSDSQGGSWTKAGSAVKASSADTIYCFVRTTLIASAVSMTVTFACTGDNATGAIVQVASVSGMTFAGSSAVRQTAKQDNQASGGTPAPAFASSALTGNPTLGVIGNATNPATLTAPTNWSGLADSGYNTPATGAEYVARNSGFTGTTITWGGTSGSAFGSLIVELDASAPVTVSPGTGAATYAGLAAAVLLPVTRVIGLGAALYAGFAPTVSTPTVVRPAVGVATYTGFAPTVTAGGAVTLHPGVGAGVWTAFAPTVTTPVTVAPGTGAAGYSGLAPAVSLPVAARPGTGTASYGGLAPAVGRPVTARPGTGLATWTGQAPAVGLPRTARPGVGAGSYIGFAPTVSAPGAVTVTPGLGAASYVSFAPTVTAPWVARPGVGIALFAGFAPTVTAASGGGPAGFGPSQQTTGLPGLLAASFANSRHGADIG